MKCCIRGEFFTDKAFNFHVLKDYFEIGLKFTAFSESKTKQDKITAWLPFCWSTGDSEDLILDISVITYMCTCTHAIQIKIQTSLSIKLGFQKQFKTHLDPYRKLLGPFLALFVTDTL